MSLNRLEQEVQYCPFSSVIINDRKLMTKVAQNEFSKICENGKKMAQLI